MNNVTTILITLIVAVPVVYYYLVTKSRFKKFLFSSTTGVLSLFLLNILSSFMGLTISMNVLTITISIILGIPGVVSMLILTLL